MGPVKEIPIYYLESKFNVGTNTNHCLYISRHVYHHGFCLVCVLGCVCMCVSVWHICTCFSFFKGAISSFKEWHDYKNKILSKIDFQDWMVSQI